MENVNTSNKQDQIENETISGEIEQQEIISAEIEPDIT